MLTLKDYCTYIVLQLYAVTDIEIDKLLAARNLSIGIENRTLLPVVLKKLL